MFRGRTTIIAALAVAVALPLAVFNSAAPAMSGFTAGVNNTTNRIGTGTAFVTAKDSGNTTTECTSVPAGSTIPATTNFSCTGDTFATATTAASGATPNSVLTNFTPSGNSNFSAASFRAASCYPEKFTNTLGTANTNDMLVRGGVTYQSTGPYTGTSYSTAFNGTNALGTGTTFSTGLQTFSTAVWFKTSAKQGAIFGFADTPSATGFTNYDRMLYLDTSGFLNYGTYVGGNQIITGTTSVADGSWHLAVTVNQAGSSQSTTKLWVDGVAVGTKTISNTNTAANYTGYWRVGQSNQNSNWNTTAAPYFNGSIAGFAVMPLALSDTSALNLSKTNSYTSDATYAAGVASLGATQFWPLTDDGTAVYTGGLPTLPSAAADPCTHVRVTIDYTNGCLYPGSTNACPALSSTYDLSTLVTAGALPFGSGLTAAKTVTVKTTKDSDYATFDTGLHVLVPMSLTMTGWPQIFTWTKNDTII